MDYRTLKYILAVAEEKSISKAAKRLYISQPSLSHCILKQEKRIGVSLFDRTKQPLQLTYAGERYVETASHILGAKERLEKELEDIANTKKGRVVIGVTKPRSAYLLPNVLPRYKSLYPNVEVVLAEEITSLLESMLIGGKLDIAILLTPLQSDHLISEHLCDEEILLSVPAEHWAIEYFTNNGVDLSVLKDEPFILYKPGQRVRKISDKLFSDAGYMPKVALESQTAETILRLVSVGMGCAFIPKSVTQYTAVFPQPAFFLLGNPPISSSFAFAWVKNAYLSWAAQEFMKITRDFIEEETESNEEKNAKSGKNLPHRIIIYDCSKPVFRPE